MRERKKERESSSLDEVVREKRKRERKRALVCFGVWRKWKGKKRKEGQKKRVRVRVWRKKRGGKKRKEKIVWIKKIKRNKGKIK